MVSKQLHVQPPVGSVIQPRVKTQPPPMQQRHRQRIPVPPLDINDGTGSIPESWADKIVTDTILYALTDDTSIQTLPFYLTGFAPKRVCHLAAIYKRKQLIKPSALVRREVLRRQQFPNENKMIQSVEIGSRLHHERNPHHVPCHIRITIGVTPRNAQTIDDL